MKLTPKIKDKVKTTRFIIPYRIYGNGGPDLICLNGVQQSMAMWQSFVKRFSAHYRIVIFDFPGQGKSEALNGSQNATLDEQVDILYNVIQASKIKELTICSASWGGVVAIAFAAKYPELVKRLVLGSIGTKPNQRMVDTIQTGFSFDPNQREEMAETLINSFGQNLPPTIKRRINNQFQNMAKEQLHAFCEHGLFVIATNDISEVVNLKRISADTVLINGENDTIIDLKDVESLASKIPNCTIKIVKDVGHFLHLESDIALDTYHSAIIGN